MHTPRERGQGWPVNHQLSNEQDRPSVLSPGPWAPGSRRAPGTPGSSGRCSGEAARAVSQGKEAGLVTLGRSPGLWVGPSQPSYLTLPLWSGLPSPACHSQKNEWGDGSPRKYLNVESHEPCASPPGPTFQQGDVGEVTSVLEGSQCCSPRIPPLSGGNESVYSTGHRKELLKFDAAKYCVHNLFSFLPSPPFLPFHVPIFCSQFMSPLVVMQLQWHKQHLLTKGPRVPPPRAWQCVLPPSPKLHHRQS